MMGSTHALVGTSLALLITQPSSIAGCVCAIAGGAIGGLIPDLDMSKSDEMEERVSSKWKTALGIIIVIAGVAIIDSVFDLGIAERLVTQNVLLRILCVLAFLALVVMGAISSHRSFMHSIIAAISLSLLLYFVIPNPPSLSVSFIVGYFSHIFLDLFNKRGIQIFWPPKENAHLVCVVQTGKQTA